MKESVKTFVKFIFQLLVSCRQARHGIKFILEIFCCEDVVGSKHEDWDTNKSRLVISVIVKCYRQDANLVLAVVPVWVCLIKKYLDIHVRSKNDADRNP